MLRSVPYKWQVQSTFINRYSSLRFDGTMEDSSDPIHNSTYHMICIVFLNHENMLENMHSIIINWTEGFSMEWLMGDWIIELLNYWILDGLLNDWIIEWLYHWMIISLNDWILEARSTEIIVRGRASMTVNARDCRDVDYQIDDRKVWSWHGMKDVMDVKVTDATSSPLGVSPAECCLMLHVWTVWLSDQIRY